MNIFSKDISRKVYLKFKKLRMTIDVCDIVEEMIVKNEITKNSNMEQISKQFSSAKDREKHRKKHRERGS